MKEFFKWINVLVRNPSGFVGVTILIIYLCISCLASLDFTPYSQLAQNPGQRLQEPSLEHLMGTDLFGRDVASRLMVGIKNSILIAGMSVLLSGFIGTFLGIISAYIGGLWDMLIMRIMDVFFAFPAILLALLVVAVLGSSLTNTVLAITVVYTPIFARVARGPALSVKNLEFVQSALSIGTDHWRIIVLHILPNIMAPIITQCSLALSWALLTEAGLSFLGLGTQPPNSSIGVMLNESRKLMEIAPWLLLYPGIAITLGVLGFNLLGDALRDTLDPRLVEI